MASSFGELAVGEITRLSKGSEREDSLSVWMAMKKQEKGAGTSALE